jgi:hypothetical protein
LQSWSWTCQIQSFIYLNGCDFVTAQILTATEENADVGEQLTVCMCIKCRGCDMMAIRMPFLSFWSPFWIFSMYAGTGTYLIPSVQLTAEPRLFPDVKTYWTYEITNLLRLWVELFRVKRMCRKEFCWLKFSASNVRISHLSWPFLTFTTSTIQVQQSHQVFRCSRSKISVDELFLLEKYDGLVTYTACTWFDKSIIFFRCKVSFFIPLFKSILPSALSRVRLKDVASRQGSHTSTMVTLLALN